MKLDRDGSGTIDKEEFLQIPQIATNPLASRMIAIFDEECVPLSLSFLNPLLAHSVGDVELTQSSARAAVVGRSTSRSSSPA